MLAGEASCRSQHGVQAARTEVAVGGNWLKSWSPKRCGHELVARVCVDLADSARPVPTVLEGNSPASFSWFLKMLGVVADLDTEDCQFCPTG